MMSINDSAHPIWPVIRLALLCLVITPVLWFNATAFDETELRAILQTLGLVAAGEGLLHFGRAWVAKSKGTSND